MDKIKSYHNSVKENLEKILDWADLHSECKQVECLCDLVGAVDSYVCKLQKYYELSCDYCGVGMCHYPAKKPDKTLLLSDAVILHGSKHFCSYICRDEYLHDLGEKRYLNLKQNGKIHPNY